MGAVGGDTGERGGGWHTLKNLEAPPRTREERGLVVHIAAAALATKHDLILVVSQHPSVVGPMLAATNHVPDMTVAMTGGGIHLRAVR